jgi:hypothetical protein
MQLADNDHKLQSVCGMNVDTDGVHFTSTAALASSTRTLLDGLQDYSHSSTCCGTSLARSCSTMGQWSRRGTAQGSAVACVAVRTADLC